MPATQLYLLRHAEVEVKYQRVFGGRIDMELSPRGPEQAQALARYVSRHAFDAVYASPMLRVQQTLAPLARDLKQPATICPELREVDFGDWTGLGWDQVFDKYRIKAFQWLPKKTRAGIPNGECRSTFAAGVEPRLRSVIAGHHGQS